MRRIVSITLMSLVQAVCSFFVFLAPAQAQKFHDPSSDELQMTADPRAPGASAVILDLSETTDDSLHSMTYYVRIKVLKDDGVAAGKIRIDPPLGDFSATDVRPKVIEGSAAYVSFMASPNARIVASDAWTGFQVTDFKARTIHSDGKVVPFEGRIEDSPAGVKSAYLSSVEVGSILEYSYIVRYDEHHFATPYWDIQKAYFVHQAHYVYRPCKIFLNLPDNSVGGYLVDGQGNLVQVIVGWPVLPGGVKVKQDNIGYFSLDMSDIPALPQEEWMASAAARGYRVQFYYKNGATEKDFWSTENAHWTREVDRLAEPTPAIREAVAATVASGDKDLDKAKKLYAVVQAFENTDLTHGKTASQSAAPRHSSRVEATLADKSGTSQEIALTYLAMLRAAGLTAYDMRVVDRDKGAYSPEFLSSDQFDADLIVLSNNSKETVLDPGDRMCPFLGVDWKHQGATGLRQSASGVVAAMTPSSAYAGNSLMRTGDITLDAQGSLTGLFQFVMRGQRAIDWRQLNLTGGGEKVRKAFDLWLATTLPKGVEGHVDHFLAIDNPEQNLIAVVKMTGSLPPGQSGSMSIPRTIFETASQHPFVEEATRQEPVDMHYAEHVGDEIVYHLPDGFSLQQPSPDATIPWAQHAVLAIKVKSSPGQVFVTRSFTRAFTLAKLEEYPQLHDYYKQLVAADQLQLTVVRSSPSSPAGN
jgi:hypothetical protein